MNLDARLNRLEQASVPLQESARLRQRLTRAVEIIEAARARDPLSVRADSTVDLTRLTNDELLGLHDAFVRALEAEGTKL